MTTADLWTFAFAGFGLGIAVGCVMVNATGGIYGCLRLFLLCTGCGLGSMLSGMLVLILTK
jgi:hypothetical protein